MYFPQALKPVYRPIGVGRGWQGGNCPLGI